MRENLINKLLNASVQRFIEEHADDPAHELVLKYGGKTDLPIKEIAEQLECRKKAGNKLPKLKAHNLIYRKIPLEQASSEATASYKASRLQGKRLIDLTGGLGIDSIFYSRRFEEVIYCEINEELAEIAKYNFSVLGIRNIEVITGDSIDVLAQAPDKYFDYIYADPARRNDNRRSVDINYLKPDIISNLDLFKQKSNRVCIKLAPAFDPTEAHRQFQDLEMFEVVSVNNECKETLVFLRGDNDEMKPGVSAVVLNKKGGMKAYRALFNNEYALNFSLPQKNMCFYEPDVSIRQARLSGLIAEQLKLKFISQSAVYLTSGKYKEDFPGRSFRIREVLKYNAKEVTKYLSAQNIASANISRSDFPNKPEELKKMFRLKDGGHDYLFFTKDMNSNLLFIHAEKSSGQTG